MIRKVNWFLITNRQTVGRTMLSHLKKNIYNILQLHVLGTASLGSKGSVGAGAAVGGIFNQGKYEKGKSAENCWTFFNFSTTEVILQNCNDLLKVDIFAKKS